MNDLQQKMSRFHGLQASNPERKQIANTVKDGCESVRWQVGIIQSPACRMARNPHSCCTPSCRHPLDLAALTRPRCRSTSWTMR